MFDHHESESRLFQSLSLTKMYFQIFKIKYKIIKRKLRLTIIKAYNCML